MTRITKFDIEPVTAVIKHESDDKGFRKITATFDVANGIVVYDVDVFSAAVGDGSTVPVYCGHSLETAIHHYNEGR